LAYRKTGAGSDRPQDQQNQPQRNRASGPFSTAKLVPFFAAADTYALKVNMVAEVNDRFRPCVHLPWPH